MVSCGISSSNKVESFFHMNEYIHVLELIDTSFPEVKCLMN